MGVMICRFINSPDPDDDGIYWLGDATPPKDSYSLYDVMERYLTTGETVEILKYDRQEKMERGWPTTMDALRAERRAHSKGDAISWVK